MQQATTKFERSYEREYKAFWRLILSLSREVIAAGRWRPQEKAALKARYLEIKALVCEVLEAKAIGIISDPHVEMIASALSYKRSMGRIIP